MPSSKIEYIDRRTGEKVEEDIFGKSQLEVAYGEGPIGDFFSKYVVPPCVFTPFICQIYGWTKRRPKSQSQIAPFIKKYGIDATEFLHPVSHFKSFNDFFIRKLKPDARKIGGNENQIVIPADGRHLFFSEVALSDGFYIKGQKFDLKKFLGSATLAKKFEHGSMIISRLAPVDYHRFHFPCDCESKKPRLINGSLYSVNPIALKRKLGYIWKNKRMITELKSEKFGNILYVEIGATNVGSIVHTSKGSSHKKGDEKGYFEFGGSCIVTLFEPNTVIFDDDLVKNSADYTETYIQMGDPVGRLLTT